MIAAEGEHKASRALRHAADVIADSPAALQLRYLQTLSSISSENNTTVIFPLPIDIMAAFVSNIDSRKGKYKFSLTETFYTYILLFLGSQMEII